MPTNGSNSKQSSNGQNAKAKKDTKVVKKNGNGKSPGTLRPYFKIFRPGEILLEENTPPNEFHILYSGKVTKHFSDGNTETFSERGNCIGLISSIMQIPFPAKLKTDSFCLMQTVPRSDISKLMTSSPEMGLHLLLMMAETGYNAQKLATQNKAKHKKLNQTVQREMTILKNLINETTTKINRPEMRALQYFFENNPLTTGSKRVKVDHVSLSNLLEELDAANKVSRV